MWQNLSLRARLNALLAVVLLMGLAVNIARLVFEAAPRVQAEDQSVVRLAREFVETLVAGLADTADPETRLTGIVEDLKRLRHVSITRESDPPSSGKPATIPPAANFTDDNAPPAWFVAWVQPEQMSVSVPVVVNGRSLGALNIASQPSDEMAEIWDGIVTQIEVGATIAAILLLITMTVVSRALAPIETLAEAMAGLERGHYATRVSPGGSPELFAICEKLNHLAETLQGAVEEKRRLAERVVSLQDVERKEIARELHDEFGPYLFALRAHGTSLARLADVAAPDMEVLRTRARAMLEQVNAVQQVNRRVLERLRPVGLAELGLRDALDGLIRLWREAHPGVAITIDIAATMSALGETAELTIYRIVQEALTNVFRHAGATEVVVTIADTADADRTILVTIEDNGSGLPANHRLGLGMTGMRERVMALGGDLTVISSGAGVTVQATVPDRNERSFSRT
jgi:two-component system sensor histidine kinase UhpB